MCNFAGSQWTDPIALSYSSSIKGQTGGTVCCPHAASPNPLDLFPCTCRLCTINVLSSREVFRSPSRTRSLLRELPRYNELASLYCMGKLAGAISVCLRSNHVELYIARLSHTIYGLGEWTQLPRTSGCLRLVVQVPDHCWGIFSCGSKLRSINRYADP